MEKHIRKRIILPILFVFFITTILSPAARAAMVTTETLIKTKTHGNRVSRLQVLMARQDVQDQLCALGVDPQEASARIAALTDMEIRQLQNHLNDLPAGGGAIEVIGIVFIVILILELVGVIDIFKKI
jgi:hypothetical protein